MKRLLAVLGLVAALTVTGCGSVSGSADNAALQAENTSLKDQVKQLEAERDGLKKQLKGDGAPASAKISQEQLRQTVLAAAPAAQVGSVRMVEFPLSSPQRWVAVYVVELVAADKRPAGSLVVDAVTGQVLTASNPPSGQ